MDESLPDSIFMDAVHPDGSRLPKDRMTITRLRELEKISPQRISQFLGALRAGASFKTAAGILNISPITVSRWMERGRASKSGPYKQFHDRVIGAIQVAATVAEAEVKAKNPLAWLKNGPGRHVTDDWQDSPREVDVDVNVQVDGQITTNGRVQIEHVDVVEALKHLKNAGVSLDSLTLEAVKINAKTEVDEDDESESLDDETTKQGTNYIGHGKHYSHNPSLPVAMRERVQAIEHNPKSASAANKIQDSLEAVDIVVPQRTILERLKAIGNR